VVAVALDVGEPGAEQGAQLALGGELVAGGDLAGAVEQRLEELVADRDQERLLAADVVVEAAGGEAGGLGQVGDRGRRVAGLGLLARRRRDHLGAATLVAGAERRALGSWGRAGHRDIR